MILASIKSWRCTETVDLDFPVAETISEPLIPFSLSKNNICFFTGLCTTLTPLADEYILTRSVLFVDSFIMSLLICTPPHLMVRIFLYVRVYPNIYIGLGHNCHMEVRIKTNYTNDMS